MKNAISPLPEVQLLVDTVTTGNPQQNWRTKLKQPSYKSVLTLYGPTIVEINNNTPGWYVARFGPFFDGNTGSVVTITDPNQTLQMWDCMDSPPKIEQSNPLPSGVEPEVTITPGASTTVVIVCVFWQNSNNPADCYSEWVPFTVIQK